MMDGHFAHWSITADQEHSPFQQSSQTIQISKPYCVLRTPDSGLGFSATFLAQLRLKLFFEYYRKDTCEEGLSAAQTLLNVPQVITAEHLSSPNLDELSCITYLSYFVREDGPAYNEGLRRVNNVLRFNEMLVRNFRSDWNDGRILCHLVDAVGGFVPDLATMRFESPVQWNRNLNIGVLRSVPTLSSNRRKPYDTQKSEFHRNLEKHYYLLRTSTSHFFETKFSNDKNRAFKWYRKYPIIN